MSTELVGVLYVKKKTAAPSIYVGDLVYPMVRDLRNRVKQHIKVTPIEMFEGEFC